MTSHPAWPLILPYLGVAPLLHGPVQRAEPGSAVLGRVTLGAEAVFERHAVVRADGHEVSAGDGLFMGEHATVHIAHDLYGTELGRGVSIGANAVVHACTVGDGCVVQAGACVLDGATLGAGSVLAAGSVVFPRAVLPAGHWCEGVPAVAVRALAAGELQAQHQATRSAPRLAAPDAPGLLHVAGGSGSFVAATAHGSGPLHMAAHSSLWFGCRVQSAGQGVMLAEGCNVQDNSVLQADAGQLLRVGAHSTVGHNVHLHGCRVGASVLVGMLSVLAPGTVVHDRVLIAAGSRTEPGQVLDGGWLWAGRPARALSRLDERKLQMLQRSAATYREYAGEFAARQHQAAGQRAAAAPAIEAGRFQGSP